jgi:hypothetical protein
MKDIQPYTIDVAESILTGLGKRLDNTRWPPQIVGSGWDGGMDVSYLRELCDYWKEGYNWRITERRSTTSAYTSSTSAAKALPAEAVQTVHR